MYKIHIGNTRQYRWRTHFKDPDAAFLFLNKLLAIIMINCNPWSFFINSSVSPFSLFIVYDLSITTIVEQQTMGKIIFIFIFHSHFSHTNKVSQIIFIVCSIFLFWQQWDTMRNMTLFIYARLFNIVKNQKQQQRWEEST